MDKWRMLFALGFAVIVAYIVSVVVVQIQSGTWQAAFAVAGTAVVGLTYIILIFGIQVDELTITRDGITVDFSENDD